MKKTHIKLIILHFFFLLLIGNVKAQPENAPIYHNLLFFKSDTNVFINNEMYNCFGVATPYIDSINHNISTSKYYYPLSISKENIIYYKDTVFCILHIQLIKRKDTMNIFIHNIIYKYENHGKRNYTVSYIPFLSGSYELILRKPDISLSYENIYIEKISRNRYNGIIIRSGLYDAWDISPENWEELKIDTIPKLNKRE